MSFTQTYIGTLYVETCIDCGMCFGLDKEFRQHRLNDHKSFYCPKGHGQCYSDKSDVEKLQDEVNGLHRKLDYAETSRVDLVNRVEQLGYSIRAQKAAKTKIMNRIKNGVCPCCQRSFQNLQNHFKTKHPELITDK